jgi:hypothetical protein
VVTPLVTTSGELGIKVSLQSVATNEKSHHFTTTLLVADAPGRRAEAQDVSGGLDTKLCLADVSDSGSDVGLPTYWRVVKLAWSLDKLPRAINSAFNNLFYDAVMTVDVSQEGPNPVDPPPPVPTPYPCKAYVEKYSAYYRASSLVEASDRKVIVLASSLAVVPVNGARLMVNNITFSIISHNDGGSNGSVWEIQGRMG